ncbi:STAS domain-containing protein [Streptomyces kunmingensis]|uniref:STAS domain-containing protein n=1 Tax=Streptomyces kunmingensis TaxID=68225 RepID=A0ABU6C4M8_9ACTN|nr:STAS domain-containing protein [Streptomyces kunmingensis]MEB3959577.1 STAS domain-containing protein [Streptomyces kunmingensis]
MATPLHLAPRDIADRTLITFPAEIDLSNAPVLLAEACALADERAGGRTEFILDLTRTAFLDSQGVRLLLELRRYLRQRHGALMRVAVPEEGPVRRVLTLAQTRRDVPVHNSVEEALRAREE